MDLFVDPILLQILSYFTFHEVTQLACVNKQFQRVRKQLVLVKPPDGRFVSTLVDLNNDFFEGGYGDSNMACKDRFTCAGCTCFEIRKLPKENSSTAQEGFGYGEEDPEVQVCLTLFAKRGVSQGVQGWGEGKDVTVLVKGFFDSDPDGQYDQITRVLKQIHPHLEIMFGSLLFLGRILDKIVNQMFSLVLEKQGLEKKEEVTLDQIREVVPILFPGELAKHALSEGNKNIVNNLLVFKPSAVKSQILFQFPEIQFESEAVIIFMTAVSEYIIAELLELGGNAAMDNRTDVILVDHLIMAIKADVELNELIKLEDFNPVHLANQSRQEKLLKGTIIIQEDDDSKIVKIETEPFPIRFQKVMNAQVLELFDVHQNQTSYVEGVLFADNFISADLHKSLMDNVNKFAAGQEIADYHPGSGEKVRDYVHPGLYSYVEGVSQFVPSADLPSNTRQQQANIKNRDLWGREYETSRFQFLPTYIDSQKDGSWRFRNEINNLPKEGNESLYQNLEDLFALCVPYLEQVIGYARTLGGKDQTSPQLQFFSEDAYSGKEIDGKTHIKPYKLNGKSLQVICKIVDIELQPGQVYEGVWHVEGMSHENIIATTDYIAERDESIVGADLRFKRAFLAGEASAFTGTGQDRTSIVNNMIDRGMCPLGTVETKAGRLIVFPNSHVHKIFHSKNEGTTIAKRRIVVFFIINPEVRIISTQEVTPQSQKQVISYQEALQYRLELMEVRKFHKQDWNVREISLLKEIDYPTSMGETRTQFSCLQMTVCLNNNITVMDSLETRCEKMTVLVSNKDEMDFLFVDPILLQILSYFTFHEVTQLACVNKQFQRVRKQLVLVKPPDGRYASTLVDLNNDFFEGGYGDSNMACKDRFTCAGCTCFEIRKLPKENSSTAQEGFGYGEEDPEVQVCLTLFAKRGVSQGVQGWGEGKDVTVLVKGFFDSDPDGQYDQITRVLKQIHLHLEFTFGSLIFLGRILDKIVNQIFSLVLERSGGKGEEITLDQVREVFPIVFPGELAKHALSEGNKNIVNNLLVFKPSAVKSQILFQFPEIQFESETVIIFMTAVSEYIIAELLELGGNVARDNRTDVILVDHLIMAIKADVELNELIKLEDFNPVHLANQSRQEKLLKGTIIIQEDDDSKIVKIETEPFPIRFQKVMNAQVLELFDVHQNQTSYVEGVLFADNFISADLHKSLMDNVNKFAAGQEIADYHPGSGEKVRDYVHPGLYSYVEGVSQFVPSADLPSNTRQQQANIKNRDLWGREYETSRFQFLPTYIDSQKDGSWRFRNEINNLPKEGNESLYQNLEDLFALCVPYLEQVIGYARTLGGKDQTSPQLQFFSEDAYSGKEIDGKTHIKPYKLNGKSLQVICKIVDIELQPGQVYEGVWHVEGMSHENIIATTDYIAERDESIVGADLRFKRAFLAGEASAFTGTGQDRTSIVNNMIDRGMCPLGTVETKAGRLIVFPNSHVHKIFHSKNEGTTIAKRRIVVFFIINPEVRIISTQEVTPQSQKQVISYQEALQYRLELMEVRKFHKQDWNVREISLCEH